MDVKSLQLSRAELERGRIEIIRRGGWKAGVWLVDTGDRRLLIKDLRHSSTVYKWIFARWVLLHEAAMYRYINHLPYVPRFVGWVDGDAIAIEYIAAINLGRFPKDRLTLEFYRRLETCVREMHECGVVHLDLRTRRNILVTADGDPMLVDFGSALYIGRTWLSRRVLIPLLARIDNSAILKFRGQDFPESLSDRERQWQRFRRARRYLWPWTPLWRLTRVNRAHRKKHKDMHVIGSASSAAAETPIDAAPRSPVPSPLEPLSDARHG